MTQFLWTKEASQTTDEAIQSFMSGEDVVLDRALFSYDIRATAAHAKGLEIIDVLTKVECEQIVETLDQLQHLFDRGEFVLEPPLEDGHSAIEFFLTKKLGPIGQKVHTGRSRNDQIQVALRLYLRERLTTLAQTCHRLARAFLDRAIADEKTPMPGYTHLQRAVPSSVGLWLGAFAESFADIEQLAILTRDWLNTCPLGTAAGYGVNLPLARQEVADMLGFERLQRNPMYVQNSRGRYELQALSVLAQATLELRRFSWDISLYTTQEFSFVSLDPAYVTGSSIMPNKSNPDFVELSRAQHSVVQGAIAEMQSLLSLPSGYQRDLQLTKPPLLRAFHSSLQALRLNEGLVRTMSFDKAAMVNAIDPSLYSTDIAIDRVTATDIPFREAYRRPVEPNERSGRTPERSLSERVSLGEGGDLGLADLQDRLDGQDSDP